MIDDRIQNENRIEKPAAKPKAAVPSFARGLNFYKLFWVFFIGCFLGVVVETLFYLVTEFRFTNRTGLLYGPFNLVYGFGALLMTIGLHWLTKKRAVWIFLGGAVLGGGFEYLCSWVQETLFGTVSWQYRHLPFNLNGRVSLLFCMFWGALALLWLRWFYPMLSNFIEKIPNKVGIPLTWVLVVFMLFNITVSALAVSRQSQRHNGVAASNAVDEYFDEHYPDDYLKRVYPSMQFVN